MHLPGNLQEDEVVKQWRRGKGPSLDRILRSLPRPHPDPQFEWHLRLYDQYTKLKRSLENRTHTPLLSDDDLKELNVIRGAEFNIDERRPIDLEPRFFVPSKSRQAARYVRNFERMGEKWPKPDPESRWHLNRYGKRDPDVRCIEAFSQTPWEMIEWSELRHGRHQQHYNPYWRPDSGFNYEDPTRSKYFKRDRIGSRPEFHEFAMQQSLVFKSSKSYSSRIPHSIVTTEDTLVPDNRILRSELLLAVTLLRRNLTIRCWPGHHTHPVLVLSFHETGSRIIQMHAANDQLHVRVSRRLDHLTHDGRVPADVRVIVKWLLAKPIGNTAFSVVPKSNTTEERSSKQNRDQGATSILRVGTLPKMAQT